MVGVLRPRIVTPSDFTRRYTEREQLVVLAHERTHIVRQDPRINAMVALAFDLLATDAAGAPRLIIDRLRDPAEAA